VLHDEILKLCRYQFNYCIMRRLVDQFFCRKSAKLLYKPIFPTRYLITYETYKKFKFWYKPKNLCRLQKTLFVFSSKKHKYWKRKVHTYFVTLLKSFWLWNTRTLYDDLPVWKNMKNFSNITEFVPVPWLDLHDWFWKLHIFKIIIFMNEMEIFQNLHSHPM